MRFKPAKKTIRTVKNFMFFSQLLFFFLVVSFAQIITNFKLEYRNKKYLKIKKKFFFKLMSIQITIKKRLRKQIK